MYIPLIYSSLFLWYIPLIYSSLFLWYIPLIYSSLFLWYIPLIYSSLFLWYIPLIYSSLFLWYIPLVYSSLFLWYIPFYSFGIFLLHSFIHSGHFYSALQVLYYSETLPTTARILYRSFTPKRTGNCIGKGLAQGPYVTARPGVEPTTLRLKVTDSSKAPSRPTFHLIYFSSIFLFIPLVYSF